MDVETGSSIATLQVLLRLAHSADSADQERSARQLSDLVAKSAFPAVSYGPLVHVLAKLVEADNLGTVLYSARALKNLLLDDALRPAALSGGISSVLLEAMGQWKHEPVCLREILGAVQTLLADSRGVSSVKRFDDLIPGLVVHLASPDADVSQLSLSCMCNVSAFSGSILLRNVLAVEAVAVGLPTIVGMCSHSNKTIQGLAVATIANAAAHPVLAARLLEIGALERCQAIERSNKAHLSLSGTSCAECAETASLRMEGSKDPRLPLRKYTYKYGTVDFQTVALDSGASVLRLSVLAIFAFFVFSYIVFSEKHSDINGGSESHREA